jgi:hypothetical protein
MNIKQSIIDDIRMLDKRANEYLHSPNLLERLLEHKHISEEEFDLFIEYTEYITERDHYHNIYLAEKVAKKEYNLHDIIDYIKSIDFEDVPSRDSHWLNGMSPDEFL